MKQDAIRRSLVWAGIAAAFAIVMVATAHMDYSVHPAKRKGGSQVALHGGAMFSIPMVVDRRAPCIPRRHYVASVQG